MLVFIKPTCPLFAKKMLCGTVLSFLLLVGADSARILGIFPMPSISHQVVFRALYLELAKRGHELVVITPNPALNKERPKDNVTEIDIGHSYEILKSFVTQSGDNGPKRGVISDVEAMLSDTSIQAMFYLFTSMFDNTEVNRLLQDKNQKFDLIIAESIMSSHLIFAKVFNAPVILISSFYGFSEGYEIIGAVTKHPMLYPNLLRNKFKDLTFFEKIREVYYEIRLAKAYWQTEEMDNKLLRTKFGEDAPTVQELRNYVCLLFLNSFPIFDNNRPVPPSVVYLGALHLQPVKELPKDLQKYLDNSKRGVVYVSLGTNVRPSMMDKELLDAFLDAFKKLPYDILWKFDGENIENIANNVKVQKWFPQRDLLEHPNVKVFVTQGGIQSTDEAINSGVPLVGIPMLADQWYNVNKYVELGIGVQLDAFTLTAEDLVTAVERVISDDRNNIKQLKAVMYDQPQRPLERAVWWTEHVLRHGGARHLRSPAANMSYWEYLMLDFILILVSAFVVLLFVIISFVYYTIRLFKSGTRIKIKQS